MNTTQAMARLRAADPARGTLTVTADDVLDRSTGEGAGGSGATTPGSSMRARPRDPVGRSSRVAIAAAAAIAFPILWPTATPSTPAALAVTADGDAVHVTIPRTAPVSAATLQNALDRAGVRAAVRTTTPDCADAVPDGLAAGYDVAPPAENLQGFGPNEQRFTFYPARMPSGTTLLFALDESDGVTTATTWLLVDRVPACVPPMFVPLARPGG